MNVFYVYEHWRPDTDLPFYIGKGTRNRAYKFKRNAGYNTVVETLNALGMCVEVRLFASGLSESVAMKIEIERIRFWRVSGILLTNRTDGGEGFSGFIRPTGIRHSEESKRKLSEGRKGIKFSPEHLAKLANRKIGVKRKPFTEETRAKMRITAAKREAEKRARYGSEVRRTSRIKESV